VQTARFHSPEDVQDSIESLHHVHGGDRSVIYWILLLVTAAAALCLPLVKVDMSLGAPGQVRPAIERLPVYPAVTGNIKELFVTDNQAVQKGDVLLSIDSTALDARLVQNRSQQEENDRALGDVTLLLASQAFSPESAGDNVRDCYTRLNSRNFTLELPKQLRTAQYVRQHALFLSDYQRLMLQRSKTLQDLARGNALHEKDVISELEYDQQRYAAEAVERELDLAVQQALARWQADKLERELKRVELESEAKQLQQQKELYTLRAPVDGIALGFVGLHSGVFIPSGQRLGEISPGGNLQADVYISPRDVGFVRTGQPVNIQVDAFPYTEWGMIKGRVRDISQDFVQVGQQLAFKAVIDLDSTQLRSAAGVVVDLRLGMTLNARFVLKKRTLFNLLYGKLSDSLDPRAKPDSN
jgi:membrane fusion protein, peptide pheromone/bacteriocin exporter